MKWNWHIAGYGLLALVLIGLATAYEGAQRDKIKSDAIQQAQATYQKQLEGQIADRDKIIADREADYKAAQKAQQEKFQQAVTPAQISQLVAQVMGLKQPVQIVTPAPTPTNPNPQPVAQVSLEDAPQVKAYVADCETCKLEVPKLQADLADRQAQMALAQKQIESLQTQRDAAVKASKGGSWLRRAARAGKYLIIGAGAGAALLCGSGHCK